MHPSGAMPSEIGRAVTADGIELRTRHWPAAEPWAAMLIVHGLGEQSGRYEHVGEHFAAAGIDTYAYDHRGNGGSGGRRGDIDRWSRYHDDLEERLAAVRAAADGRPVILYAHSMGALIAAGYLLTDRPRPDLTVLTAPGLDTTLAGWKKRLAPVLAPVLPTLSVPNGVALETLSRDPEVGRRVKADPLNGTTSTARFGAEALAEQARVRAGARADRRPDADPPWARRWPCPATLVRGVRGRTRRRAADLPGPAPRAPQRAGGSRDPRRRRGVATPAC